jgi:3-hydroxyisobutyrate dehydrogenase-like beta-hydroxyacid dehydrogenase
MAGGDEAIVDVFRDVFATFASDVVHVGRVGNGARMKLVTNLVLGLNRAALAEGLAFASALGLEGAATLEVMRRSMAYSRIMDTKGEKMINGDFTTQAKLSQHLKDVRLILSASTLDLPLSAAHCALLEKAVTLGLGDLDNSALIRTYES